MNECNTVSAVVDAHAKINLFLDITGRRADGYHTVAGIMQAVSLCDRVHVTVEGATDTALCSLSARPGMAESIVLTCSEPSLPTDNRNLAWRAAEAFFAATGRGCRRLAIHIDKNIPAAAGLAGGSTDAAAVLTTLNSLYSHPLDTAALCAVGVKLGADVPFCIMGGAQMTEGVGEILTTLPPLPPCRLLIACAGEGVSTPAAYRTLDEMYGGFAPAAYTPRRAELNALNDAMAAGDMAGVCEHLFNLFESAILPIHSMAGCIRDTMWDCGATAAMMSGSGPSVFGIFPDEATRAAAISALSARGIAVFECEPV